MRWWIGISIPVQRMQIRGGGGLGPSPFRCEQDHIFPKSSTVDDNGLIVRSPDASRSLTWCNCDCKAITTAICFGLHRYSIRCIHLAQRCVSSRQMTDNIFEIETSALAHLCMCYKRFRYPADRLCLCVSQCKSLLDLPRPRKGRIAHVRSTILAHGLQQQCDGC